MINPNNKISSSYLSLLPSLSLSHVKLRVCEVCINEGEHLPIYTFHVTDQIHDWGRLVSLTGPTSPRETPNTHYIILHWGLFP